MKYKPTNCPMCEYDRKFPETSAGGWIYIGNNGPYGPCPLCNPKGLLPMSSKDDIGGNLPKQEEQ